MLLLDPERAAASIRRSLRPGARLAAAVWQTAEHVPFFAVPRGALARELDLPAPEPDAPGPMRLGAPGALLAVLEGAGFADVTVEAFPVTFDFASAAELWEFLIALSSSTRKLLNECADEVAARARARVLDEVAAFADATGRLRIENLTWVGTGSA